MCGELSVYNLILNIYDMLRKFFLIVIWTLISNFTYAELHIQQGDILAFDPTRACDVLAIKLEKMKVELKTKKMTITDLEKSLRSAATPSAKYGNILLEYHRTLDQFNSMKKDYERLVLAQEKNCMSDQDKKV